MQWSQAHEVADYEIWIDALPVHERERVRTWVERCSPRGRRDFWECCHSFEMTWERVPGIAAQLRAAAFARSTMCQCCQAAPAVSVNADETALCSSCISPGDVLVVDTRAA